MVTLTLKCPKCFYKFRINQDIGDFEAEVDCPKCGYWHEAWFFPHRPVQWRKLGIPSDKWEIGDHYPNDALNLKLGEFMEFFNRQRNDTHGELVQAVIRAIGGVEKDE